MPTLKKILRNRLSGSAKTAILCIGSELRADDAAGSLVAGLLRKKLTRALKKRSVKIFSGHTAPENLTGEIKRFKPAHLVIVDTADLGKKAGALSVFTSQEIGGGVSFSTHKMPARILVDYLVKSLGCAVTIVGIQPRTVDFGVPVSRPVREAAGKAAAALAGAIP